MKLARMGFKGEYECKKEWDDDCFVQCGDNGVVLSKKGNYRTAFFEAFPKNPKTFIRGEGETIEEAEEKAWKQLEKYRACPKHEFERRDYTNGAGFCKHCNLFVSKCFKPSTTCKICGKPTYWTCNKDNEWYCKEHVHLMPYEEMNEYQQKDFDRNRTEKISKISDFIYSEDRNYYLEHNPIEIKHLDIFMKSIFNELALKLGFENIETADIKEKYIFAVKNFAMGLSLFANDHEYIDYITYEKDNIKLIALKLNEQKDISDEDSNEKIYIKTGREIYLFGLSTDSFLKYIEFCTKNNKKE